MKRNIFILAVSTLIGFTACQGDRELTYLSPEIENGLIEYALETPSENSFVFEKSTLGNPFPLLKAAEPDYGMGLIPTFSVELGLDEKFTTPKDLGVTALEPTFQITNSQVNDALNQMSVDGQAVDFDKQIPVYFRIKASLSSATNNSIDEDLVVKPSYSSVFKCDIQAIYVPAQKPLPAPYYIVGLNGKWGNTIGDELIPFAIVPDTEYSAIDGSGVFTYTGIFKATDNFKMVAVPGSWDVQWGNGSTEGIDNPVFNDGGSKNFTITDSAAYKITHNSIENSLTIEKVEDGLIVLNEYEGVEIIGQFNGWADAGTVVMDRQAGTHAHIFWADLTLEADSPLKFRKLADWGVSWGHNSAGFPYFESVDGNIMVPAGSYRVVLNTLDGTYHFFEQE